MVKADPEVWFAKASVPWFGINEFKVWNFASLII